MDEKYLEITEKIKEGFRKFAEKTLQWNVKDTEIKSITVYAKRIRGRDKIRKITVGEEISPPIADTPGEPVLAIFESTTYLVVTPNRGGIQGVPYLWGKEDVIGVEKRLQTPYKVRTRA